VTVTTKQEKTQRLYCDIFSFAHSAGLKAARETVPIPMVVEQHKDMTDDNSPVEKDYFVPEGVCGFGWVNVKPGTSTFAKWLVKSGHAHKDSYYGGVSIGTPREFGQSMARNEAYAHAFAHALNEVGITAYGMSRID
jgi:hypothetical protein